MFILNRPPSPMPKAMLLPLQIALLPDDPVIDLSKTVDRAPVPVQQTGHRTLALRLGFGGGTFRVTSGNWGAHAVEMFSRLSAG
jgi:hypothetical protein